VKSAQSDCNSILCILSLGLPISYWLTVLNGIRRVKKNDLYKAKDSNDEFKVSYMCMSC